MIWLLQRGDPDNSGAAGSVSEVASIQVLLDEPFLDKRDRQTVSELAVNGAFLQNARACQLRKQ
jgi:hypothetical protein